MLPTLVDRLEAVAVGIENVRGIVARIVIQARAWLTVISRASPHRCVVERIHPGLALGDKSDSAALASALPCLSQKKTRPSRPKPLRSGCPSGPSLPL